MTANVNDKCKILVGAASKKWPDLYTSAICSKVLDRVREWGSEEKDQLFATRLLMLDWAARQCGQCTDCSLSNNRACLPVWADGTPNARVFVIGEGPGQFDQRTGIPFTHTKELGHSYCYLRCASLTECYPKESLLDGQPLPPCAMNRSSIPTEDTKNRAQGNVPSIRTAAEYLNSAIDGLFVRESWNNGQQKKVLSDLYITNIVKCRSLDKNGKDYEPKTEYSNACWKWLELQLTIVQPQVVIVLGNPAGRFVFGMKDYKISKFDGWFGTPPEKFSAKLPKSVKWVGTAYHPSYTLRQYDINETAGDQAFTGIRKVFKSAYDAVNGGS